MGPASVYGDILGQQPMPFAYVTRESPAILHESPRFRELEREFRRQYGLE